MISSIASQGMKEANFLGTQKVIGLNKTVSKHTKKKDTQTSINIGIQAWEIGGIIASIGAYEFLTQNSFKSFLSDLNPLNPLNPNTQASEAIYTGTADVNPQPVTSALTRLFEGLGVMRI